MCVHDVTASTTLQLIVDHIIVSI